MIIDTIPFEVFLNHVFPYLMSMDIQKLTIVSKEMKALCENNEIWKEIYIRKRKREFYQKEFPLAEKRALTLKNEVVERPLGIAPENKYGVVPEIAIKIHPKLTIKYPSRF